MTKLEKVILAFFLKNQFFLDFRIFENFLGSRYLKIFYSPFSYQSGPKLLIYAKKLLKVIFGALRELYLNYAWKNSSSTLKMARTFIFLIAIIFFDL